VAYRGSRGITLLFHDHGRRAEVSASGPGRFLPSGKARYLLLRRLGRPQGRSGQVRKISPPPGFDTRTVQPVASRYTDYVTRPTVQQGKIKVKYTLAQALRLCTGRVAYRGSRNITLLFHDHGRRAEG